MRASKFVVDGQRLVRRARLFLVSFLLIFPVSAISALPAVAQSDAAQPPAATPPATPPPTTQPAPLPPPPTQTPEERARVLREAQARINARREARIRQIIRETYGAKFEAYFGGGYLRFHPGEFKQRNQEAAWNLGITDYIRPRLGLTADVRGYYGTAFIGNNAYGVFQPSISQYTFLFGPQYRVYEKPKWAISLQGLAGVAHGNFDTGTGGLPSSYIGLYPDATVFNLSLGAPIDYNVSPGLAIRVDPLYLLTTYGSSTQSNLGFNIGAVYRWGRQ